MRRMWIVSCLALACCFFMTSCKIDGFGFSFGNLNGKYTEEKDWTVKADAINKIDTETTHGSIVVTAEDTNEITIHAVMTVRAKTDAKAEEFADKVSLHVDEEGDLLHIYKKQPKTMNGYSVGVSYTIACPPQVALELESTHGKIDVTGIENTVDLQTTHGAVALTGGRGFAKIRTTHASVKVRGCEGEVDAQSSHGSIELNNVNAGNGEITVGTSHARINLENCSGHLNVRTSHGAIVTRQLSVTDKATFSTSHGSIDVEVVDGNAPIQASTTHSSITMKLPPDYNGQLDAETTHGRVNSDFPIPVHSASKSKLKGPIGSGGNTLVHLRASHGSIAIKH